MIEFTVVRTIPRPVGEVFAVVGDPLRWPEFETDFRSLEAVNGAAPRAGSTYRYSRKVPGKVVRGRFRLTEYEPGVSVGMEGEDWVGPFLPAGTYRLAAVDGGTRVEMEERIRVRGPMRLLTPLLAVAFRGAGRKILRDLEAAIDRHPGV